MDWAHAVGRIVELADLPEMVAAHPGGEVFAVGLQDGVVAVLDKVYLPVLRLSSRQKRAT